jgi:hypothetical protein
MIKVTHDGMTYRVSFKHYNEHRMSIYAAGMVQSRKGTRCIIDIGNLNVPIASGYAVCHPSDKFEKEVGRRHALKDAMERFGDKNLRRALWEAYFAR